MEAEQAKEAVMQVCLRFSIIQTRTPTQQEEQRQQKPQREIIVLLQEKQTLAGHQADYFALLKKIQEEVRPYCQIWALFSVGQIHKLLIISLRWLNFSS